MLRFIGVELTQAIQYFGSSFPVCGSPNNPQPCGDNTIPLVAGKPTAVRVYVEGATPGVLVTGFGVKLLPDGTPSSVSFPASTDLLNVPSPPARENSGHSLNLVVPAQASTGKWRLSVSIFEKLASGVGQVAMTSVDMEFVERALVPIRLVRMHYKGGGLDVAPPTVADFWQMADFMQRAWPVPLPGICIVRESVEVFDGAFLTQVDSDDPAEIGTTGTIWDILVRLKASEGLPADVIYFGFYPDPAGPRGGVGDGKLMIAPNVLPELTAHELGHTYGIVHAPTPFFGPTYVDGEQSFPRYGSLPWGSIGEVGFDPRAGVTFLRTHFDFMGYDIPRWVAPYQYARLFASIGAPTPGPCSSPPRTKEVFRPPIERHFSCYYVEGLPEDFVNKLCGPKIPLEFPWLSDPEAPPGPVRAMLLDARGATIFEDTFDLSAPSEPQNGQRLRRLVISVPELAGAKRLVVMHGDKVIEDSELSLTPVAFEAKAWALDGSVPVVRVEWTLSPEDVGVTVFVRASSDNARSWTAFNAPVGTRRLDFDPAALPPGDGCVVEVLAGARLRTASWISARIPVKTGRNELLVLRPRGVLRLAFGEVIELAAVISCGPGYGEIIWSSDRDGDLGVGGYQLARLSPGEHALSARRGANGKKVPGGVVHVADPLLPDRTESL